MISFLRNIYEEFKEEQSQSNLLQDEIYYKVCCCHYQFYIFKNQFKIRA